MSGQRRALNRIEGLICFVLAELTVDDSVWVAVFWFALGFLTILGLFEWATERVARRVAK